VYILPALVYVMTAKGVIMDASLHFGSVEFSLETCNPTEGD
jgi:hypothetical protein